MKAILDHVGIAVQDLAAALSFYRDALGLEIEAPEEVSSQRVRAHFIPVGESSLELLEATAPDSPIAAFLDKRGPGLHHITLRVDDIARRDRPAEGARRAADRRAAAPRRRGFAGGVHSSFGGAWRAGRAEAVGGSRRLPAACQRGSTSEIARYRLGDLELISVNDGFFAPRRRRDVRRRAASSLWSQKAPPDDRNRITLAMRPLIVRGREDDDHRRGSRRQGERQVQRHLRRSIAPAISITRSPRPGCPPKTSTSCSATHLHFDHAGGFTVRDASRPPAARASRARSTSCGGASGKMPLIRTSATRASYLADNYLPLAEAGVLQLVDDDRTIMPGVRVRRTGGHTMHHQMVLDRVGRQDRRLRRRPDSDDGAPARRVDHGVSTCIRWTRSRRRTTFVQAKPSTARCSIFFEHDPAMLAGYISEEDGKPARGPGVTWSATVAG